MSLKPSRGKKTIAKTVGRITLPGEYLEAVSVMLMKHYADHPDFPKDRLNLLRCYKRLLVALLKTKRRHPEAGVYDQPSLAWNALNRTIDRVRTMNGRQSRNLRRYRQELIDLCDRCGLRCTWAPAWLHAFLLQKLRLPQGPPLAPPAFCLDNRIRVEVPRLLTEERKAVEKRLLADFHRQWRETKARYGAAGMLRDTEPTLERNVRWLYERIALSLTPPRKMQALARGEGPPEDLATYEEAQEGFEFTYRDATYKLARRLGIRLPQGRPPKGSRK